MLFLHEVVFFLMLFLYKVLKNLILQYSMPYASP
jgi:hypothetical protein